ncbi:MAG TPA: DinB family protein [Trebonia sp.]
MRKDPNPAAPERDALAQYLDYQRETILLKAEGLTQQQLATTIPTSDLTLAGILYHLALVEESWTEEDFSGLPAREPWNGVDWNADPDWEFRTATTLDPDAVRQRYRDACERSRVVAEKAVSLDELSEKPLRSGARFTLRWMLLHLIEETARHAGHADLLREAIDGRTGE